MAGKSVRKSVSINEEMDKFQENHDISLSALLQEQLSQMMSDSKEGVNPIRYVPNKILEDSRRLGLITMLSGALILIVTMSIFIYLWLTGKIYGFVVIWIAGSLISYYGFREWGKWNDVIWRRSVADETRNRQGEESPPGPR